MIFLAVLARNEFASRLGTVVEEADEAEELLNVVHDSKASMTASANERLAQERKKLDRANRKRRKEE